jgi:hypothetical protein
MHGIAGKAHATRRWRELGDTLLLDLTAKLTGHGALICHGSVPPRAACFRLFLNAWTVCESGGHPVLCGYVGSRDSANS